MSRLRTPALAAAALCGLTLHAAAQGATIEFFGSPLTKAIQFSPDGEWITGDINGNAFRWSAATGYEVIAGGTGWDIVDGGGFIAGSGAPGGFGSPEAATWTDGAGWTHYGNAGGSPGCDSFLSDLFTLSDDGSVAGGMSWQGCGTTAMAWTSSGGLQLLPEEVANHSSRVNTISGDGVVFGGWETANTGSRRAALWSSISSAPSFPLVSPANPSGFGEFADLNSDGTVGCGVSEISPFLWTASGGVQILPSPPGLGGQIFANGCSEDGTLVGGVSANFPFLNGWIWTPETGSVGLFDHLTSLGLGGFASSDVANVTGVSRDGTRICGWGNSGAFVVTFEKTWEDLGQGLAGTHGTPDLQGIGDLTAGSLVRLALTGALENAPVALVIGLTQIDAPFKGGVMVPNPDFIVLPLTSSATGSLLVSAIWPAGVPSGFVTTFQEWVTDPAGPAGFAATNGLAGTAP